MVIILGNRLKNNDYPVVMISEFLSWADCVDAWASLLLCSALLCPERFTSCDSFAHLRFYDLLAISLFF